MSKTTRKRQPVPLPIGLQIIGRFVLPADAIPEAYDRYMQQAHDLATRMIVHGEDIKHPSGYSVEMVDASERLAFHKDWSTEEYDEDRHHARQEAFWFGMASAFLLLQEFHGKGGAR